MSASISTRKLPSAIELKLRNVRLRHALLAAAHALAIGWCVLILLMILSIAIDWVFPFMNTSVRLFLTSGTLIAAVLSVAIVGLGPIRSALRWNRAAVAVDDEIPQLQERWSTVASLSAQDHSSASPMSRAMAEQVTSEAVAMSQIVRPHRVTPPTSIRPSLVAAAASVLLLAGLTAMSPGQMRVLLMRFWSPSSNITATQLTSVTGDQFVPRGESIALVTRLDGLPRSSATLTLQDAEGIEQRIQLRPNEDAPGQFVHSMRVDESLTYRVRSGDGQTSVHRLEVIDFPEIAEVQFSIDFPEYTDRPTDHRDRIPRLVKVIQGSTLNLSIKPVEPLQRLSITLAAAERSSRAGQSEPTETGESVQELVADEDGWYRFRMPLLDDMLLRPTLWSTHGLKNQRRLFSRIEVIADKAPVARVVSPTDEMAVAIDETIEISFEAHDDHGIATAELVVYDESRIDADGNPEVVDVKEIPLGDQRLQKHVLGKTQLDLKELNLAEGSEISYAIRVTDNRNVPASEEPSGDAVPTAIAQQQDAAKPSSTPLGAKPTDIAESDAASSAADPAGSREPSDRSAKPEDRPGNESAQDSLASEMLALSEKDSLERSTAGSKAPAPSRPENATVGDDQVTPSEATSAVTKLATDDPAKTTAPSEAEPTDELAVAENKDEPVGDNDDVSIDPSSSETATAASQAGDRSDRKPEEKASLAATRDRRRTKSAAPEEGRQDSMSRENASPDAARQAKADKAEGDEKKSPATAKLAGDRQPRSDDAEQDESEPNRPRQTGDSSAMSSLATVSPQKSENETSQPRGKFSLKPQENRSGQNTLTGRRRLKITERLAAIAKAEERPEEDGQIRENVVAIDRMLAEVESGLRPLVDHAIADADRAEQFRRLDTGLGNVESYVADLREQTKDNQFAFVGLQMVDITRTHVTPARDRVFAAVQRPNASDADASVSLQHIVRARELLGALLKRYDRVAQEKKLQRELDETVTMYEVYVEKRRMLMREARQNLNPLQRKMAVIEVDQEYLDRFAEVLRLRREMMEEFAQMLGDDPRLLSRYLELVKRRGKSLRDRLTEISERQYESTEEMMGWLQIDESQRPDLWTIIAELRLHSATELAEDAAELAERIKKQMPLEVDAQVGTPAAVISQAEQIASIARTISFDADDLIAKAGQVTDRSSLLAHARSLVANIERLSASLDRLQFENEGEAVADYLEPRMLETRTVADQADAWAILCESLADHSYAGLVTTEQHRLAVATQLLRVEMLNMKSELDGQFRQLTESEVPAEIVAMIQQLHRLMETITFNQVAASIRAGNERLDSAAQQQQLATDRLEEAEKLFDRIRRAVADTLDEYDVQDPNIADLRDPTLDEFLARLEREPSIAAQLGIPNRRRNLRVIADSMLWQQNSGGMLGSSGDAAAARAEAAMKMSRAGKKKPKQEKQLSEEEQAKMAEAKQAQEMLEKSLLEIEKKRDDPTTPDSQRRRLDEMAENLRQMIEQSDSEDSDAQTWQRIAHSDEAKRLLQALARGEAIPDGQWNKLLSTLDDGLWQVRGKQPPEAYRKAIEQYQDQIRGLMQTIDEG